MAGAPLTRISRIARPTSSTVLNSRNASSQGKRLWSSSLTDSRSHSTGVSSVNTAILYKKPGLLSPAHLPFLSPVSDMSDHPFGGTHRHARERGHPEGKWCGGEPYAPLTPFDRLRMSGRMGPARVVPLPVRGEPVEP